MELEKPLFIPLKTEYYRAFEDGSKHYELRPYGARWNERTCRAGRAATLSLGYGKKNRINKTIMELEIIPVSGLKGQAAKDWKSVYGNKHEFVAVIWLR